MKTLDDLTSEEKAEAQRLLVELHERGYTDRDRFEELIPGARVRHRGHRWPEAYRDGTGVVVCITQRDPSHWSRTYNAADIEMVVAYDRPLLPDMSRLVTLAQYHVDLVALPAAPKLGEWVSGACGCVWRESRPAGIKIDPAEPRACTQHRADHPASVRPSPQGMAMVPVTYHDQKPGGVA